MSRFPSVLARGADWRSVASDAVQGLGRDTASEGKLGVLYLTEPLADHATGIVMLLRAGTGVQDWIGATAFGIAQGSEEVFDAPALAAMILDPGPDNAHLFPAVEAEEASGLAAHLGDWLQRKTPLFGLVHGAMTPDVEDTLRDLAQSTGAFLAGGIASGEQGGLAIADTVAESGVSGALFAQDVAVVTGLTQGCTPIGQAKAITRCRDNIIAELDGRPAYQVFQDSMEELAMAEGLIQAKGAVHVGLPIRGADRADYVVRNLMGVDPDDGLIAVGDVVERGQPLYFVWRNRKTVRDDLARMLADVKARMGPRPARGAIYVSCLARGPNTFDRPGVEMAQVSAALDGAPVIGFFANGEICNQRLYAYTGVLSVFL